MLRVDKFPYPQKQTKGSEFIPCLKDVCHILKRVFLSCLNHRINSVLLGRIAAAMKVDGSRDRHCDAINDVPFSIYLTLTTSNVKYESILHGY